VGRQDADEEDTSDDERSLAAAASGTIHKLTPSTKKATRSAWHTLVAGTARSLSFLAHLSREFWRNCGDAVGAAAAAAHRRANGPLGGGILPLVGSFAISTSYPSLLSVPLLLWAMLPFLTPVRWATVGR
jgi:hypothetical protein